MESLKPFFFMFPMAFNLNLCVTALLFVLFLKGSYACDLNNLTIATQKTGHIVLGVKEWEVTIINECNCALSNLSLKCQGFQSVIPVPSSIFKKVGDICVVFGGNHIFSKQTINFKYAWDPPFLLFPEKGNFEC